MGEFYIVIFQFITNMYISINTTSVSKPMRYKTLQIGPFLQFNII